MAALLRVTAWGELGRGSGEPGREGGGTRGATLGSGCDGGSSARERGERAALLGKSSGVQAVGVPPRRA